MALNTMKLTKGIMFLYEVSKRESFTNIKEKWIPQIEDILDTSKLTMILVAKKLIYQIELLLLKKVKLMLKKKI